VKDFYQTWRSGKVNRMHTMPQLLRENTAEHTFGIHLLTARFYPEARAEFYLAVTLHDTGELATGDIPAHVKKADPTLEFILYSKESAFLEECGLKMPDLTLNESLLLTVFDKLEFCVSCVHEMRLGNLNAARYFKRSLQYARDAFHQIEVPGPSREDDQPSISPEYLAAERAINEIDGLKIAYLSHVREHEYDLGR